MNPGERTATDSYHNLVYHDRVKIQQFQGNTDVIIAAEVSKIRPGKPCDPSTITKERGRYKDEYGYIPYCVIKAEQLARKSQKAKGRNCIMEKNLVLIREFLCLFFNRESCKTIAESLTTDEQYAGMGFPKTLCANTLESWLLRETDRGSVLWSWLKRKQKKANKQRQKKAKNGSKLSEYFKSDGQRQSEETPKASISALKSSTKTFATGISRTTP